MKPKVWLYVKYLTCYFPPHPSFFHMLALRIWQFSPFNKREKTKLL